MKFKGSGCVKNFIADKILLECEAVLDRVPEALTLQITPLWEPQM